MLWSLSQGHHFVFHQPNCCIHYVLGVLKPLILLPFYGSLYPCLPAPGELLSFLDPGVNTFLALILAIVLSENMKI
jgi:hypothetical protein